jgi:hypothetical protein
MVNPISDEIRTGTLGELLVQLRLLQYGVQAAPPLKDSGNDLIAVRGNVFGAIQVKTTTGKTFSKANLKAFHILAVVQLEGDGNDLYLDKSQVFLIPRPLVAEVSPAIDNLGEFVITQELIDQLFPN